MSKNGSSDYENQLEGEVTTKEIMDQIWHMRSLKNNLQKRLGRGSLSGLHQRNEIISDQLNSGYVEKGIWESHLDNVLSDVDLEDEESDKYLQDTKNSSTQDAQGFDIHTFNTYMTCNIY